MRNFRAFSYRAGRFVWTLGDLDHHLDENSPAFATPVVRHETFPRVMVPHPDEVKNQVAHHHGLSPFDMETVHDYKDDSGPYNKFLRGDHKPSFEMNTRRIESMDRVTSLPSKHPMSLYRGFGSNYPIKNLPVGHEFTDHGYTGLTHDLHIATARAAMLDRSDPDAKFLLRQHDDHRIIAMVHLPAGTKGHYLDVNRTTPFHEEEEYALHRGTRFRVMGHSRTSVKYSHYHSGESGVDVVHLQVLGQHPRKIEE